MVDLEVPKESTSWQDPLPLHVHKLYINTFACDKVTF